MLNRKWKGWCEVISDVFKRKGLYEYEWHDESKWFDRKAKTLIDIQVRRLVMLMRSIELDGVMGFLDIENAVIDAFEKAERLYYGMPEEEFAQIIEREVSNGKARRRSKANR